MTLSFDRLIINANAQRAITPTLVLCLVREKEMEWNKTSGNGVWRADLKRI